MAKKKSRRPAVAPLEAVVCVLCDSLARDPNTGKPTLYGVFDSILCHELPFKYGSFSLFAKLIGKGKHRISLHLVDPRGHSERLGETEIKISGKRTATLQADLVGVEFKRLGTYQLLLRDGLKTVGRTSFEVKRKVPNKRKK